MDTNALKRFAQEARRQLLSQVGARLEQVLRSDSVEVREKEQVVAKLRDQIRQKSKEQVIEEAAYTWFNRFCALRFMDVNRYTFTGILSPAEGRTQPEILFQAKQGAFNEHLNVDKKRVVELLNDLAAAANPQQEAYRLLLKAACSAYHRQMPFLFADIEDHTELLMPDDLLSQNAILQKIREVLTEENCRDVEVIGWLYQFYISERKDEVMARKSAVPKEDIPAVTQLFTPHWIVRYLVENSLGRLWMLNHPDSRLVDQMEYYIKPDTPSTGSGDEQEYIRIQSPEEIKICDPACGSGHMLTYAFDLLASIYEEQGYDPQQISSLIIKNNLYGIEIDERAGQLTAFALMMKARQIDKRFFTRGINPNICVMEDISFSEGEIKTYMDKLGSDLFTQELWFGLRQFEDAKTFGSLIRPQVHNPGEVLQRMQEKGAFEDLFLFETNRKVKKVLEMVEYLKPRYQVVITNPPYMGSKGLNNELRVFLSDYYPDVKSDLFSSFVIRCSELAIESAEIGIMSPNVWMYISSYKKLRYYIIKEKALNNLVELPLTGFKGATVQICAYNFSNVQKIRTKGSFIRLVDFRGGDFEMAEKTQEAITKPDCGWFYKASVQDFMKIPSAPIAYWVTEKFRGIFERSRVLSEIANSFQGMITGNNEKFLRFWVEIGYKNIALNYEKIGEIPLTKKYWIPYNKGGTLRKWYGNNEYLLNWSNNGEDLTRSRTQNSKHYLRPCVTWTFISSGFFSARYCKPGFFWDVAGSSVFPKTTEWFFPLLALMCSKVCKIILDVLNPTLNYQVENILEIPIHLNLISNKELSINNTKRLIEISQFDWDSFETSWDFSVFPLIRLADQSDILKNVYQNLETIWKQSTLEMQKLEEANNRIFIEAYGLQDELTPDVPLEEITLTCNTRYRYGGKKSKAELEALLLADTMKEFISYAVGCTFGRYSLDKPGLILANQGETLQDYLNQVPQPRFMPDKDNVLPILEGEWFADDIVSRFREFLKVTFGEVYFDENLSFLENAIGRDIRSYFLRDFYNEHVKMYKKRPIYWLFSSPKGCFNALIYMHRYTPDTVAVVLNNYLRPFIEKLTAYKNHQNQVVVRADSDQRQKVKAEKEIAALDRMLNELKAYEEQVLFPLAAQKINIDLDDGVLVNYKKFGTALKYVKGLSE